MREEEVGRGDQFQPPDFFSEIASVNTCKRGVGARNLRNAPCAKAANVRSRVTLLDRNRSNPTSSKWVMQTSRLTPLCSVQNGESDALKSSVQHTL